MIASNSTPRTLLEALRYFTPEAADAYVSQIKWPNGACCPKCGSTNVGKIASRNRFQCREKACRKQFSLITGTIFEGTHLRLDQWIAAVWMIVNCRNGVSSCEIARTIGCKQQSAWHLLHRVRFVLQQNHPEKAGQKRGVVEMDSTYVGGEHRNMSPDRRIEIKKGQLAYGNKVAVHAIKDRRSGQIRAVVDANKTKGFVRQVVTEHVEPLARVYTDSSNAFTWMDGSWFNHHSVNHTNQEYVRGTVHTNGCENFFNCLRRGLKGTYIRATPEHLSAYVDEAVFRFNVRELTEWERFDKAMRMIVGKRLTYSELTGGKAR